MAELGEGADWPSLPPAWALRYAYPFIFRQFLALRLHDSSDRSLAGYVVAVSSYVCLLAFGALLLARAAGDCFLVLLSWSLLLYVLVSTCIRDKEINTETKKKYTVRGSPLRLLGQPGREAGGCSRAEEGSTVVLRAVPRDLPPPLPPRAAAAGPGAGAGGGGKAR